MKSGLKKEDSSILNEGRLELALEGADFRKSNGIDADCRHFMKVLKDCVERTTVRESARRSQKISETTRALKQKRKLFKPGGV